MARIFTNAAEQILDHGWAEIKRLKQTGLPQEGAGGKKGEGTRMARMFPNNNRRTADHTPLGKARMPFLTSDD
jgi:hypothetical protein